MKKTTTNPNTTNAATRTPAPHTVPTYAEHLQSVGHAAAYIAIRARTRTSAQAFLQDLQNRQYSDRRREALPDYAAEALQLRADHDHARELAQATQEAADRVSRAARSVTAAPADRAKAAEDVAALAKAAAAYRREAAEALAQAEAIEKVISDTTTSDRADITQAAILAYLEGMQGEDWSNTDSRDSAFYTAIKAAGRAVHALAASKGHPHTKTKVKPITPEAAAEFAATYGEGAKVAFSVRGGASAGYITVEHRASAHFPAGYYMIYHYKTYTPKPLEAAENEASTKDTPTVEEAERAADRAHLSERERRIIALLDEANTTPEAATVAAAGVEAIEAHRAETAARIAAADTQRKRQRIARERAKLEDKTRAAAELAAAMTAAGVPEAAHRMTKSRMREKLEKAIARKPEALPTAVRNAPLDLIAAQSRAAAEAKPATPVIKWSRHYPKPQPLTEAEKAAEAAAEAERMTRIQEHIAEAAFLEMRRACRDHATHTADTVTEYHRSNRTPETVQTVRAAHSAQHAAFVWLEGMTAAEIVAWFRAEAAERNADHGRENEQEQPEKTAAELAQEQERRAAFLADMARWEAAQAAKKAAEAAKAAQAAELATRRREAYNAAIRAAYAKMKTTYAKATEAQRAKATKAAEKAAAKVK